MKNLVTIFIFGLCLAQSSMPSKESDRKHDGFVGAVKTSTTYVSAISGNWQSTPRGKLCKFSLVAYDTEGRQLQSSNFSDCGRSGEFRDTFTYDNEGNRYDKGEVIPGKNGTLPGIIGGKSSTQNEVRKGPSTVFKYDAQGKKIEMNSFFFNGKPTYTCFYKYDGRGRLLEALCGYSEDKLPSKRIYGYLGDQRFPSSWNIYRADGSLSQKYVYADYQINSTGDWIKRKVIITDDTGKHIGTETRQIEYYPQER